MLASVAWLFLFLFHPHLLFFYATLLPPNYGSLLKIYIKSTTPFGSHFHWPPASCWGNSWFSLYGERVGPLVHSCQVALVLFPHHLENPSPLLCKIAQLLSVLQQVIREEFSEEWLIVGLVLGEARWCLTKLKSSISTGGKFTHCYLAAIWDS